MHIGHGPFAIHKILNVMSHPVKLSPPTPIHIPPHTPIQTQHTHQYTSRHTPVALGSKPDKKAKHIKLLTGMIPSLPSLTRAPATPQHPAAAGAAGGKRHIGRRAVSMGGGKRELPIGTRGGARCHAASAQQLSGHAPQSGYLVGRQSACRPWVHGILRTLSWILPLDTSRNAPPYTNPPSRTWATLVYAAPPPSPADSPALLTPHGTPSLDAPAMPSPRGGCAGNRARSPRCRPSPRRLGGSRTAAHCPHYTARPGVMCTGGLPQQAPRLPTRQRSADMIRPGHFKQKQIPAPRRWCGQRLACAKHSSAGTPRVRHPPALPCARRWLRALICA